MQIQLTKGLVAEIDDADLPLISGFKWWARIDPKTTYAVTERRGKRIQMHRLILGLTDHKIKTDHKDGNGLNNKRENLRPATQAQNVINAGLPKNNTSGFKGVHFSKAKRSWRAEITVNGKRLRLGQRKDIIQAARLYDSAAFKYFGEFARLNFQITPKSDVQ